MNPIGRLPRKSTVWLLDSELALYVDAFTHHLAECRYAAGTISRYLAGIAHFARWMNQCQQDVLGIDKDVVRRFLDDHLPRCNCAWPAQRSRRDLRAALGHLLIVLRAKSVIAERLLQRPRWTRSCVASTTI
jgi:integrase/recombinase XerC